MQKSRQRKLTLEDKKLAGRIKEIRLEKGMKLEPMSREIGANANYMVYVETGRRGLSLSKVYKIAKALGVPLKELFSF